jgi:hypothetical protein
MNRLATREEETELVRMLTNFVEESHSPTFSQLQEEVSKFFCDKTIWTQGTQLSMRNLYLFLKRHTDLKTLFFSKKEKLWPGVSFEEEMMEEIAKESRLLNLAAQKYKKRCQELEEKLNARPS